MIVACMLSGCSQRGQEAATTAAEEETKKEGRSEIKVNSGSINGIIETMAGKTQIDCGRKAQRKLRKIYAEENKDLEEILGN